MKRDPFIVGIIIVFILFSVGVIFIMPSNTLIKEDFQTRINFSLTIVIGGFAIIEAISTYMQLRITDTKNRIDDLRIELEKAFGPLYSIIKNMYSIEQGSEIGSHTEVFAFQYEDDKEKVDDIFLKYPYFFSPQLNNFWDLNLKNLTSDSGEQYKDYELSIAEYSQFKELVFSSYTEKMKEYWKLVGKEVKGF